MDDQRMHLIASKPAPSHPIHGGQGQSALGQSSQREFRFDSGAEPFPEVVCELMGVWE